ncbi:ubiquitin carboxyl-terminal hydrolase 17-like isoform X1 [Chlorella sorokiniana]|uniref:Ubiquitin carboxyl-terminal hydrolase 17-like isoform X1 n=1 Tax=Chlorella sorokiniana TaxID=3076 RepID=A0A2P6TJV5_CHLSO|nr:ubiquitin carboxyl-terminal hydrolase 17-like isoform X1 [Chlorella sorokiniana]|eukprot:PRW44345.1 ubiquitin carboxyl-terminal hydrolase 17-like isoform X1 [Chlorella sorokiniana]
MRRSAIRRQYGFSFAPLSWPGSKAAISPWPGRAGVLREQFLRHCANCKSKRYCSRECQVRHWKEGGHKAE